MVIINGVNIVKKLVKFYFGLLFVKILYELSGFFCVFWFIVILVIIIGK